MLFKTKEKFNIHLGARIKKIREDKNITQETLCELAELTSQQQLSLYECGKKTINTWTLYKILEALNISFEDFFENYF